MAGNQLGKTWAGGFECAMHLTGRYPDWWAGRRYDRPVRLWAAGVTGESTRDNPQRILLGPPPLRERWGTGTIPGEAIDHISLSRGVADAVDSIVVRHAAGGQSTLAFKAYSVGREKWQGETLDGVWFDEEPPLDVYVAEEGRTVVQENGFDEFPYMVSRYVTAPREIYGRSPAMTVLPDIKMLNEMNKTTVRQAQLAVEPPILVYDDGVLGRPDGFGLTPGYINYGGVNKDGRALMQPFQSGARVDIGLDMMEQRRRSINDAFLVTMFQILAEQPSMTATEAMIRAQEKGALLTPVMGRQQSEALGPMIERELAILQRLGQLPEMPAVLVDAAGEYEIEYDSPLSRAQKSEQVVGISRTFEVLAPLASAQPEIFDVFDGDALAQLAAEVNGVPQKVLNTPEQIQQLRQQRAMSQRMQGLLAAAPAANQAAGALEKLVGSGAAPQ